MDKQAQCATTEAADAGVPQLPASTPASLHLAPCSCPSALSCPVLSARYAFCCAGCLTWSVIHLTLYYNLCSAFNRALASIITPQPSWPPLHYQLSSVWLQDSLSSLSQNSKAWAANICTYLCPNTLGRDHGKVLGRSRSQLSCCHSCCKGLFCFQKLNLFPWSKRKVVG